MAKLSVLKVDGSTNVFGSFVAAEWMRDHLDDHIEELKQVYSSRRDAMLAALDEHMPPGVTWTRPDGGFFIWLETPEHLDMTALQPFAKERGVEYLAGSTCFAEGGRNTVRLSFSFANEDQIRDGIRILGEIIEGELRESRV